VTDKGSNNQSHTIRFAYLANEGQPLHTGIQAAADHIEEETGGRITVNTFCCNKVTGGVQAIEAIRNGSIDMTTEPTNKVNEFTPVFQYGDLPYIWKEYSSSQKIWPTDLGQQQLEQAGEDMGTHLFTPWNTGTDFRYLHLAMDEKPRVPEDVQGLKIRSTPSKVEQAIINNWGTSAVVHPFADTYQAIQQGVLSGIHIQPVWASIGNIQEVTDYIVQTDDMINDEFTMIGKQTWNSLSDKDKDLFEEAFNKVGKQANDEADQAKKQEAIDNLEEEAEIVDLTDDEFSQWQETALEVWSNFVGQEGFEKETIRQVLDITDYDPPLDLDSL